MPRTPPHVTGAVETARIVGFGLLAIATLSAATCNHSGPEQYDPQIFAWTGELRSPALVNVRSINGAIDLKPSTDDTLRVTASARWHRGNPKTDLKFDIATEGSNVTICVLWNRRPCSAAQGGTRSSFWTHLGQTRSTDANVTLTVYVPARVKVDARTINGDVNVAATAPVKAKTLNGTIRVATAIGPVDAETMNGSIDIRMTTLGEDGPVRAITVNGSASAYLPESLDAMVSLSSINGRIGSDYSVSVQGVSTPAKRLAGPVGAGGREVKVSTVNGSAWLHRLHADGTIAEAAATARP
ncbi:MAG TPA: DUF4097 family beta strand repeat-containing protein [Gemmatimonadaceae bacterium]|nr:DUF4097 family beta strand repeat-containing protein [Gemmatimonadaceae bacterium]